MLKYLLYSTFEFLLFSPNVNNINTLLCLLHNLKVEIHTSVVYTCSDYSSGII